MSIATFAPGTRDSKRELALRAVDLLPPFSPILNRLIATLADENVSFAKVAAIIEKDTVLSANMLRVVNSAAYNCRGTINSVVHAVAILGLDKLRNTALALSVNRLLKGVRCARGWSMADFNLHGLGTAIMADLLAQNADVEYPEGAFVAGLFHDIGKLLIAVGLPDECESLVRVELAGADREELERCTLGATHADLSALALERWNLPRPIQVAVAYHHQPASCPADAWGSSRYCLAEIVQCADNAVNAAGISLFRPAQPSASDPVAVLHSFDANLPVDRITTAWTQEFETVRSLF